MLILAAGASRRMRGRDKLCAPVHGRPLLRFVVEQALATGLPVTVTLPGSGPDHGPGLEPDAGPDAGPAPKAPSPDLSRRAALIADLPVSSVAVTGAQSASLRAGLKALPDSAWVMILLADMPDLRTPHLRRVLSAAARTPGCEAYRGSSGDTPGHPVLLSRSLRQEAMRQSGDQGAKALLTGRRVHLEPLPGRVALTDLDTPEDWESWQRRQSAPDHTS